MFLTWLRVNKVSEIEVIMIYRSTMVNHGQYFQLWLTMASGLLCFSRESVSRSIYLSLLGKYD